MRSARKQVKRNRKPDRVRRKDWADAPPGDYGGDAPDWERVMPRGERERRRAVLKMAVLAAEEEESPPAEDAAEGSVGRRGMVMEVATGLCRVDLDGRELLCSARGALSAADTGLTNLVAVGDEVVVSADGTDRGVVEAVLPRRSALARPDVFRPHLQQVIVANVDQLLLVASWREPPIWPELVDRYLIGAERNRLSPVICLNKVDLAEDREACRATLQPYVELGYRVLYTSAVTGEGIEELRAILQGRTTALAGLSGVGKSTLLAAVQPGLQLRVGEVSDHWHQGKHTTTQVSLLRLAMGGFVVDTPGVREFGLAGLRRGELASYYPEIAATQACRFANCSHTHEPGCAVMLALRQGSIARVRYDSYCKIRRDLPDS
jgi:ribosome biogenesis GTPase